MLKLDDLDDETIIDLKAFIEMNNTSYAVLQMKNAYAIEEYAGEENSGSEDILIVTKVSLAEWESKK
jgi:hypothetical protein